MVDALQAVGPPTMCMSTLRFDRSTFPTGSITVLFVQQLGAMRMWACHVNIVAMTHLSMHVTAVPVVSQSTSATKSTTALYV